MSRHNVLSFPHLAESKKKKQKALLKKALIVVFLLLVVFVALGFASRWEKMSIRNVAVEGNKVADTDKVQDVIETEIAGHYFWLYSKRNFLLYPKGAIEDKLREELKVLKDISFSAEDSQTLKVALSERAPAYTWCGENFNEGDSAGQQCYFMDETGYIFSTAPFFSGDVYFRFFGALPGEEPAGYYFLPDIFQKVSSFLKAMEQMGLKPVSLLSKSVSENMEIYLSSGSTPPNAPKIIISRDFELEKTAENLQAAITTEPLQTDLKKKYSSLVYIDLSFGNKVYFKFK